MKTIALSLANHHEPALWPDDLRVREYPTNPATVAPELSPTPASAAWAPHREWSMANVCR
jgi:hypothetical protein